MKKLFIIAVILFCIGGISMEVKAQSNSKILVAYFSWSGNAKALAGQIANETGGDLFEIKTTIPYPDNYKDCTEVAKEEQKKNARPALSGKIDKMEQYTNVFLCYPNWWGTIPQGVFTFLESYDFSGNTLYPLVTNGGSGFGSSLNDIKKLCPNANIGDGLSVKVFSRNKDTPAVTSPDKDVTSWLRKLGISR
jgi:flavodoxin